MNTEIKTYATNATAFVESKRFFPACGRVLMNGRIAATDLNHVYVAEYDTELNRTYSPAEIKALAAGVSVPGEEIGDYPVDHIDAAVGDKYGNTEIVDLGALVDSLKALIPFVSKDESQYNINGVCIERPEGSKYCSITATDGHRLLTMDSPISVTRQAETVNFRGILSQAIIPVDAIKKLIKVIGKRKGFGKVSISPSRIKFSLGVETVYIRLVDGVFPDWNQSSIIPEGPSASLSFDRKQLIDSIKTISLVGDKKSKAIPTLRFKLGDSGTSVKLTFGQDTATASTDIQCSSSGESEVLAEPIEFSLQPKYVLDYLEHVATGDRVSLAYRGCDVNAEGKKIDSLKPIRVSDNAYKFGGAICVLMPMRFE